MSRLSRVTQLIFGSTAGTDQLGVFGSLAAGAIDYATNIGTSTHGVQKLSQYLTGWFAGILGSSSPAIEDMNGLFWMITSQLAYIFQLGVAEWDPGTTYYIGSIVQDGSGNQYISQTNSNLNNALTVLANWVPLALSGNFTPTITWSGTTPSDYAGTWSYLRMGNIVAVYGAISFTAPSGSSTNISALTVPVPTLGLAATIGGSYNNGTTSGTKSGILQSNSGSGTTIAVSPALNIPPGDLVGICFNFSYVVS